MRMTVRVLLLLSIAIAAWADPITWSIQNTSFSDGGRVTGYFVFAALASNS